VIRFKTLKPYHKGSPYQTVVAHPLFVTQSFLCIAIMCWLLISMADC
jgi:hypothetical protein